MAEFIRKIITSSAIYRIIRDIPTDQIVCKSNELRSAPEINNSYFLHDYNIYIQKHDFGAEKSMPTTKFIDEQIKFCLRSYDGVLLIAKITDDIEQNLYKHIGIPPPDYTNHLITQPTNYINTAPIRSFYTTAPLTDMPYKFADVLSPEYKYIFRFFFIEEHNTNQPKIIIDNSQYQLHQYDANKSMSDSVINSYLAQTQLDSEHLYTQQMLINDGNMILFTLYDYDTRQKYIFFLDRH